jgi:DnaJ family protein C protein 2
MLALPLSDSGLGANGSKIFASVTLHPDYKKTIDAAGHFFDQFYKDKVLGHYNKKSTGSDEEETKAEDFKEDDVKNFEKKRHKRTEADKLKDRLEENLYNILGLQELGMGASEEQVKKAYRKLALIHHPDKATEENTASTKEMWLKIQNAYETLIDSEKKKKYDSTLPFEDKIPEDDVPESEFFNVFKPVFIRNAFWSNKKPVPDIGDLKTDIKKVEKFYQFWENFDSWRDFSQYDEYNLEEAENREERRYMEKENKKNKGKHLAEERKRINRLCARAREFDPRLLKIRKEEEEKAERVRLEKQAKKDQYKKEQEDKAKRQEEERLAEIKKKEDEEKAALDEKKRVLDEAKKAKKDLKTVFAEKINADGYDRFWLESFMEKLKHNDIVEMGKRLIEAPKDKALDELKNYIADFEQAHDKRTKEMYKKHKDAAKQRQEEEKKKKEADWTMDELSLLSKGLVKYPVGSKNRWATIASYLGSKSSEEVLAKAKEVSQASGMKAASEKASKEAFDQVKKSGMKVIDAPADTRVVYDISGLGNIQNKDEEKKSPEKPKANGQTAAPKEASKEAPKEAPKQEEEWSQDQQKQLELALKKFPPSIEAQERWTKIAEAVPGKTKKQCVDRFKVLRDAIKKAPAPAK